MSESTVLLESLIDDIPRVALRAPVRDQIRDVVGHDLDQGSVVPSTGREPSWKLVVPHEDVATSNLTVGLRKA